MNNEKLDIKDLRKCRRALDITSDDAARECHLSVGFYNRIEKGYITWIRNETKRKKLLKFYKRILNKAKR